MEPDAHEVEHSLDPPDHADAFDRLPLVFVVEDEDEVVDVTFTDEARALFARLVEERRRT
jgi:hypothetical protein